MPLYLGAEELREAVDRLSRSRARPSLCEFLILKHAMTSPRKETVTLSLRDETYMRSVDALTAVTVAPDDEGAPAPFFNPFGTSREARRGWRTAKYPSNGPPDTVNGPGWRSVIEILEEGPRRVRLRRGYLDHLPSVIATSESPPPLIEDAAAWFFRSTDLESVFDPTVGLEPDDLALAFTIRTGLSPEERLAIFGGG